MKKISELKKKEQPSSTPMCLRIVDLQISNVCGFM